MWHKKAGVVFCVLVGLWVYFAYAEWEIRFYGAVGGEVAGSCYVLTNGIEAILIDCGSHISEEIEVDGQKVRIEDYCPFDFAGENIKAIIITHAHDDHIGRLHYFFLHYPNYTGPVFMTRATKELYVRNWQNTINYMKDKNGGDLDEYTKNKIAERLLSQIDAVDYLVAFSLIANVSAYFVNTGHIPGAAAVVVNIVEGETVTTLTFSGDIGPGDHPLLPPLPLHTFSLTNTDILVVESTYGDVTRDPLAKTRELQDFYSTIRTSYEKNGLVIIPTFALDRTQRVLITILDGIRRGELPEALKIAIGGSSSQNYTLAYKALMADELLCSKYFSTTTCVSRPLAQGGFTFERFNRNPELAKNYHVIITPSGTGASSDAEVLLRRYLSDPNTVVLKVGWAPPDSPMGQLAAGANKITMAGKEIQVRASIKSYHSLFSGHADQLMLVNFIQAFPKLKYVVITHGSERARNILQERIQEVNKNVTVIKPGYRQKLKLKTMSLEALPALTTGCPSPSSLDEVCISASEARQYVGRRAWVHGVVKSVRRLDYGRVFLNLGQPYPDHIFTVMVTEEDIDKFDDLLGYGWENTLINKTICINGTIRLYNNIPEIIATNPEQLKVIPGDASKACPCK